MKSLRSAFNSTIFLKATSLILGFLAWTTINELFTYSRWVTVPVCFYNEETHKISAPETVTLELTGKRAHLRNVSQENLAVHIDAQSLHPGANRLAITRDHLLMPQSIAVTTIIPESVIIKVLPGDR